MIAPFNKIRTWRERIGQTAEFPLHVPTDVERAMVAEIAELRAAAVPIAPTDISAQLREFAGNPGFSHGDYADVMRLAADECERFYGGMAAWKRTAEKKDADWNAQRVKRINERCKARATEALEDLMMQLRIGITPENEGGFHAHVYNDQDAPVATGYGATPRAAIDAAIADQQAIKPAGV